MLSPKGSPPRARHTDLPPIRTASPPRGTKNEHSPSPVARKKTKAGSPRSNDVRGIATPAASRQTSPSLSSPARGSKAYSPQKSPQGVATPPDSPITSASASPHSSAPSSPSSADSPTVFSKPNHRDIDRSSLKHLLPARPNKGQRKVNWGTENEDEVTGTIHTRMHHRLDYDRTATRQVAAARVPPAAMSRKSFDEMARRVYHRQNTYINMLPDDDSDAEMSPASKSFNRNIQTKDANGAIKVCSPRTNISRENARRKEMFNILDEYNPGGHCVYVGEAIARTQDKSDEWFKTEEGKEEFKAMNARLPWRAPIVRGTWRVQNAEF